MIQTNYSTLRPSLVSTALKRAYKTDSPLMLWGPPGVGKSQMTAQAAADLKIGLIDIRLMWMDPVDLHGLPVVHEKTTSWCIPEWFPKRGKGILLIDEIASAPTSMQASAYQLINERRIGEHVLPPGWLPMGASNRDTDHGVYNRMPTPLANRFVHIEVEPDVNDWSIYAHEHGFSAEVIAFNRWRRELHFNFDPQSGEKAFPTPRSWERVSKIIQCTDPNEDKMVEYALIAGTIGQGAASEFFAFLETWRNLPDLDSIIRDPKGAPVPEQDEVSTHYAILSGLAHKANRSNFSNIIIYAERMSPEFQIMLIKDANRRHPEVSRTKAWKDYMLKHPDAF